MNEPAKFNNVVSFLWAIADLLNGAFKKSEFQKIILPFTVLRRLDYALEATKTKVLETEHKLKERVLKTATVSCAALPASPSTTLQSSITRASCTMTPTLR